MATSTNERAEKLMGRRRTDVLVFDLPCELGYRCPVCLVEEIGLEDEALHWSEYEGFLWCERCNRDYPSALCVPLVEPSEEDKGKAWRSAIGPDAAVGIFLDSVEQASRVPELDTLRGIARRLGSYWYPAAHSGHWTDGLTSEPMTDAEVEVIYGKEQT